LRVYYVSKGFTDITGYTMEKIDELYNGKYTDFVYEADRSTFVAAIERLLRTMSETVVSYRIVSKRGDIIWVSDSMNIVKDSKGNRHIFAVVLDITDEKSSAMYKSPTIFKFFFFRLSLFLEFFLDKKATILNQTL
jgi:PAS domain S-box-containing protein